MAKKLASKETDVTALAPEAIGVKNIKVSDLTPNPHHPRTLFDRAPLQVLEDSIAKVGILVPLTVYWAVAQNSSSFSMVSADGSVLKNWSRRGCRVSAVMPPRHGAARRILNHSK